LVAGERDELTGARRHNTALERPGHADSVPAAKLQQTFIAKDAQRAQNGVRVYVKYRCNISRRRQPLASMRLPVCDRAAYLRGDLIVQECRV